MLKYLITHVLRGSSLRFHVQMESFAGADVEGAYKAASLVSLMRGGECSLAVDKVTMIMRPIDAVQAILADLHCFRCESQCRARPVSVDNWTEFVSSDGRVVEGTTCNWISFGPVVRWRNAFIDSFKGRLRDECQNSHVIGNVVEAQALLDSGVTTTIG